MDRAATESVDMLAGKIRPRLEFLYGSRAPTTLAAIVELARRHLSAAPPAAPRLWDERDVVLITYGDQIRPDNGPTLPALGQFIADHGLAELINTVHVLPFCPYSSDDGFSVIDYRAVNPELGTWNDMQSLGTQVELMFDLVLNHCSQHSPWFQGFLAGTEPFDDYFITVDPGTDTSAVTRPRSLPLLTGFQTSRGPRHVWTTFSADQVDLNFAQPQVLTEMLDILLFYVRQGARMIRLDAIAYLWKQLGTNCIHLPQTHEVVRLMRDVLDALAPHVLLITETNVPHEENTSYFGIGDEAHLVYQFSLPPLLLDALLSQDARPLAQWLGGVCQTMPRTTYFNFTASHDGVGVRPLEGLVPPERLQRLSQAVLARGGRVSTRRAPNGDDTPYELNVSYFDALGFDRGAHPELHVRRFLSSQAVMLALRGVPGVYFHSLVGTPNYHEGVEESGQPRRINRRKYGQSELNEILSGSGIQRQVFDGYRGLLRARIAQPAFHPDAPQELVPTDDPGLLAFRRTSLDGRQRVLVATNVTDEPRRLPNQATAPDAVTVDLITGARPETDGDGILLKPFQTVWLK